MKKLLLLLLIFFTLGKVNAQYTEPAAPTISPRAFYVHGGYSWLDGVVGFNFQNNYWGIGFGWMPNSMPLSGERVNSFGMSGVIYSAPYYKDALYLKIGVVTNGYIYQDSYGYEYLSPMSIIMGGYKFGGETLALKLGLGYGWCEYGGTWTGEVTLGYALFKMK